MSKKTKLLIIIFITLLLISIFVIYKCYKNPQTHEDDLITWLGEYTFNENFSDPNYAPMVMDYNIKIYNEGGIYYADLEIVGQTTWIHVKANVYGDAEWISLVNYQELPDNMTFNAKSNVVMISFRKKNENIYTYWGEIEPMLIENAESGKNYFVKIS